MNDEGSGIDRRLLARVDPAASLAPVGDERLTRLTEDAMTTDTTPARPEAQPRQRPWRTWAIAGAGMLAAGAAAAIVLPALLAPAPTLTMEPVDASAMCLALTPELVAESELAFRADVTGIDGGVVSLRVTERFQGEVGDVVQVAQGDDVPLDGAPIVFENGATYLISTDGTTVSSCSASGVVTPELEALFDAAFPG
jgi:hypothetical protein